jgi:CHAT domain-containing protein
VSLARAQLARGFEDVAEGELLKGIEELEGLRKSQQQDELQVSFFDQAGSLFDEIVRFEVRRRHDPERALTFVERGRARQLLDALGDGPARAGSSPQPASGASPLAPTAIRETLPDGLALIYYLALDDHLYTWVLTREASHFQERALPAEKLTRLTTAYQTALESRASLDTVRHAGALLHDVLVRPLAPWVVGQRALVFIPDEAMQFVSFASLWDRESARYLVETHLLGVAPSGTTFVRASAVAAAARVGPPRVLLVGNPRFGRGVVADLQDLPEAEREVADIARLYAHVEVLIGEGATKAAFLDELRASDIVHFAGHAASSTETPADARLFLAPDSRKGDSGILHLHELSRAALPRTRMVVLAACRSGAGQVSRVEGALSLGRPFLAAGVPSVVASRWSIEDSIGRRFFVMFHQALLAAGDALPALRQAQIAFLRDGDASLAHPSSWAAFVHLGGLGPHSLAKGDRS